MARGNLSACLAVTLPHEGGYVDHPSDPGGATNMGITFAVLQKWMMRKITKQDVRDLKLTTATKIYERNYWQPLNGELLPYGVDLAVFDAGVNSGVSRGAKWLQGAVGAVKDGKVGRVTLDYVTTVEPEIIVRRICAARLSFVQGLGTFKVFGKGWSRRIADIEAKGVAMWLREGKGWSAGKVADEMARQAEKALGQAVANGRGAAGAGGGGAVVGLGEGINGTGWLLVVVAVAFVAAVLLVVRGSQNKARAEAYGAELEVQKLDEMAGQ